MLYTTAQSTNVCIAILQRDDTGAWQVRQSVEGLADTVENVRLAQLRAGDDRQLVVGYVAAQGDPTIWPCMPTTTGSSPPFWSSPTSNIWWRTSPAAAVRI